MYTISFYNLDRNTFSPRAGASPLVAEEVETNRLLGILQRIALLDAPAQGEAPRIEVRSASGLFSAAPANGGLLVAELLPTPGAPRRMTPYEALLLISPGIAAGDGGTPPLTMIARTTKAYRYIAAACILAGLCLLGYSVVTTFGSGPKREGKEAFQLVTDKSEGAQQFAILAGSFSTGLEQGDRSLSIAEDGGVKLRLLGDKGKVLQELDLKATPAKSGPKTLLVLSNGGLLEPQSRDVLELYGDTYRRVN